MTLVTSKDNLVLDVCALGMGSSEIVLQDDDGNSAVTTLDELSCSGQDLVNPSAINVENSSDVIIGPVTQFNGPVTIYQRVNDVQAIANNSQTASSSDNKNGKLVKSESTSSDTTHPGEKSLKECLSTSKYLKYVGILIIVIILMAIILSIVLNSNKPETKLTTQNNDAAWTDSYFPTGSGQIISREEWGGRPPLNFTQPLIHPTPLVIISHSATPFCDNFKDCAKYVRSFQDYHVSNLHSPDIGYNFIIGGDGNVYVGRGWDIRNFHRNNSIGINFIGNYIYDNLTEDMIKSAKDLLSWGLEHGKLAENYTLVCHNQTYATESPGRNVYKVVKNWPHFHLGYIF